MPFWRLRPLKLVALVAALCAFAGAVRADNVDVNLDQARVIKLPDRVATIIIGNPLIADASLQAGGFLVVTGKGFGATNLMALDRQGRVILERTIQVSGPSNNALVVVYRGASRESYSCTPDCSPRITLGDATPFFNETIQQATTRNGLAQGTK